MEYQYLVKAADELFAFQVESYELTSQDIARKLTIACNALELLQRDVDFVAALRELAARRREHADDFASIVSHVDHFTKGFLVLEERALQRAGLSRATIDYLLEASVALRTKLREQVIDPDQVIQSLQTLRNVTCTQASVLSHALENAEQKRSTRWVLKQVGIGVAGVALIVVNLLVAPTVDMSGVGVEVSTTIGTIVLTNAATNLNSGYRESSGIRAR